MSFESTIANLLCQTYARRGSRKIEKGIDEWAWAEALFPIRGPVELPREGKQV